MVSRVLLVLSVFLGGVAMMLGLLDQPREAQAADRWCHPGAALPCQCPQYNNEVLPDYPNDGPRTGCFKMLGPDQFQCQPSTPNTCEETTTNCAGFFYNGGTCVGANCWGGVKDPTTVRLITRANCRNV